jgi:RNA polymerase sigma-70 factor (ECF subfamily)
MSKELLGLSVVEQAPTRHTDISQGEWVFMISSTTGTRKGPLLDHFELGSRSRFRSSKMRGKSLAITPQQKQVTGVPPLQPVFVGDVNSDTELMGRISNGDRDALSVLYRQHAPKLMELAYRILGDTTEAEDLLHDVFLEVWRSADSYDADRATVSVWLRMRTRSRALDRRRAKGTWRTSFTPPPSSRRSGALALESVWPSEAVANVAALRISLVGLPEAQAKVVYLGYFEGLTCAEIAERLDLPIGTVKSRIRLAMARLRELLSNDEERTHGGSS